MKWAIMIMITMMMMNMVYKYYNDQMMGMIPIFAIRSND